MGITFNINKSVWWWWMLSYLQPCRWALTTGGPNRSTHNNATHNLQQVNSKPLWLLRNHNMVSKTRTVIIYTIIIYSLMLLFKMCFIHRTSWLHKLRHMLRKECPPLTYSFLLNAGFTDSESLNTALIIATASIYWVIGQARYLLIS